MLRDISVCGAFSLWGREPGWGADVVAAHQLCARAGGNVSGSFAEMMELWFTLGTVLSVKILLRWQKHMEGEMHHPG